MADSYGKWLVTFERKGVKSQLVLVDRRSEVAEQARFFSPTYGRVVKVEAAK